ncbi:hypothetical protein ACWT_3897 [Actinoplanes sp. SE50]|uniref:ATP-binding protein n=1 Tax=unclassified Actinoplanes TaxID=2626549 RepID=UPI00023ED097|nr:MULTISPECIES: ATP-binding protein [unclassified Actinoplanes]AEV84921.1 hypothetical protein ACPL_4026 [Actinoplanes sp. SE50/110]ATO83312.1 hypothetical protein ACWT_3897 [Actinoplanes sp. SE50]SLM00719.1 hypothetical protein ACSP50_3952 [Actinoplanes sp. SE50/110]
MLFLRHPPRTDEWFARRRDRTLADLLDQALAEPEFAGWLDARVPADRLRAEVCARAGTDVFPIVAAEQQAWEQATIHRLPSAVSERQLTGPRWINGIGKALIGLLAAVWAGVPIIAVIWAFLLDDPRDVLRVVGLIVLISGGTGAVFGMFFGLTDAAAARHDGESGRGHILPMVSLQSLMLIMLAVFFGGAGFIGAHTRGGWGFLGFGPVGLPVFCLVLSIGVGLLGLMLTVGVSQPSDADLDLPIRGPGGDAEQAFQNWRRELRERALLPFLRSRINEAVAARYSLTLDIQGEAPGLRSRRATEHHIVTPAVEQLFDHLEQLDGASIALAGPRGTGKTMLLHALRDGRHHHGDDPRDLVVVVSAPVEYAPRDFVLHLCLSICDVVGDYFAVHGPGPILRTARRRRAQLRHLRSDSRELSGRVGRWGAELTGKVGSSSQAQPFTYPELVAALHELLDEVVTALRGLPGPPKLVIGIDELDRIGSGEGAERFLNDIKGVFDTPGCYFLVSVSEDALRAFDLAGHGLRDVFDSTFDEMVRVEHLDFVRAVELLGRRVVGLPDPFVALAYCLSGGLPRQLIRVAREMARHRGHLTDVARALVSRHLERILQAGGAARGPMFAWADNPPAEMTETALLTYARLGPIGEPLTTHVEFLATVVAVFDGSLDAGRAKRSVAFEALARVRRYLGVDDEIAAGLLAQARAEWGLARRDGATPVPRQSWSEPQRSAGA